MTASDHDVANRSQAAFEEHNETEGHKFARNNRISGSTTVYVGSSHDIKSRLRQHLQKTDKATYALKMERWYPRGAGSVKIDIQAILDDPTPYAIQDVEDQLWIASRPIFGKFGAK